MLLVTGILLFVAERFRRGSRKEGELTLTDALVVGTVQGCAIIPGISRSGSTIAALLLKGVDGETAARFSFLLAMPAVFGAALLSARDLGAVATAQIPLYLAGMGVAFLTGLLSIHLLLAVIRRRRLIAFAVYCWLAGGIFFTLAM
jgi:undecaprenyl-diphosphatase